MEGPIAPAGSFDSETPTLVCRPVQKAAEPPPAPVPAPACPRCQTELTDPNGLGLCPQCGYCRSLEESPSLPPEETPSAVNTPLKSLESAAPNVVAAWRAMQLLPVSTWPMLVGGLCLLPACYLADRRLATDSRERALWSAGQLALGLLAIFVAQVWVFVLLRRQERLSIKDIFFPAHLWRVACVSLPGTGGALSLGFNGCYAVLTAALWIGGWWYWWYWVDTGDTEPPVRTVHVAAPASKDWRDEYHRLKKATIQVSKGDGNNSADKPKEPPPRDSELTDSRPVALCVVVGYLPGENGELAGLVLGTLRDGQLTYAGTVTTGISKEKAAALVKKLQGLGSDSPLFSTDLKAQWVRPTLFCEIHQSGFDDKGMLIAPNYKDLIAE